MLKHNSATLNKPMFNRNWGGTETWISLPKILRLEPWAQYYEPVCMLKLVLYGHPDAGGYWERHCEEHLTSIGCVPVPDWRRTYWHPELKLLSMVYVDDFKMSGPSANFAKGWSMIRQKIETDEPHAVTKRLGCEHLVCDTNVGCVSVKQMEYNMRPLFEQCADSYLTLAKKGIRNTYIHIYIYIYIYIHIYVCTFSDPELRNISYVYHYVYIVTYMFIYIYIHTYGVTLPSKFIYIYIYMSYVYISIYVYIHLSLYIHIYIYIYMHVDMYIYIYTYCIRIHYMCLRDVFTYKIRNIS